MTNLGARIVKRKPMEPHRWTIEKVRFDTRLDCCTVRPGPKREHVQSYKIFARGAAVLRALCASASVNSALSIFPAFLALKPIPPLACLFAADRRLVSSLLLSPGQSGVRNRDKPSIINTCESLSKQTTLIPFRMNTYKKRGGRGPGFPHPSVPIWNSRTAYLEGIRWTPLGSAIGPKSDRTIRLGTSRAVPASRTRGLSQLGQNKRALVRLTD